MADVRSYRLGDVEPDIAARLSVVLGRLAFVTETAAPEIILEALAVIDQALPTMQHRELVSTDEVADLLLDLRLLLATTPSDPVEPAAV